MVDVYREGSFQVKLPSGHNFRFQDMPAYKSLSGRNLKEMDFGWWEGPPGNTLWLMEVKDYSHLSVKERLPENLLANLRDKVTDSLLILSSAWLGTDKGREIARSLPQSCQQCPGNGSKLKLVVVLRLRKKHLKPDLAPLRDKLFQLLQGRLALFDVPTIQLVDHNTAVNLLRLPMTVT